MCRRPSPGRSGSRTGIHERSIERGERGLLRGHDLREPAFEELAVVFEGAGEILDLDSARQCPGVRELVVDTPVDEYEARRGATIQESSHNAGAGRAREGAARSNVRFSMGDTFVYFQCSLRGVGKPERENEPMAARRTSRSHARPWPGSADSRRANASTYRAVEVVTSLMRWRSPPVPIRIPSPRDPGPARARRRPRCARRSARGRGRERHSRACADNG